MSSTWTSTVRLNGRGPSWLARSPFGQGLVLFIAVLAFVVLIPIVIVAVVLGVLAFGVFTVRRWLSALRRPNGALDGRRNVRVRVPASDPADSSTFGQ